MKTVCVYHDCDLDGQMSAAIVKHWWGTNLNTNGIKEIEFIGYNYGQPIPDLSEYDKVIMCDISFPKEEMEKLKNHSVFNPSPIYIDRHISAIKDLGIDNENSFAPKYDGIQDTNYAACELTWQYFFPDETMPEIVRLLGLYDSFRHKNIDEEQKVLEFQYGARQYISNYEDAYNGLLKSIEEDKLYIHDNRNGKPFILDIWNYGGIIYGYLCTEAKQTYKNGFEIELFETIIDPRTSEDGKGHMLGRRFICINKERFNPINFGINYHDATISPDGKSYDGCVCFHRTSDRKWVFSFYNDNGLVDCSVIAKQFGGGGHKRVAGCVITNLSLIVK